MRTGRYRVRKGLFGKSILQAEYDCPSFIGGKADASSRYIFWSDIDYKKAPAQLREQEAAHE